MNIMDYLDISLKCPSCGFRNNSYTKEVRNNQLVLTIHCNNPTCDTDKFELEFDL